MPTVRTKKNTPPPHPQPRLRKRRVRGLPGPSSIGSAYPHPIGGEPMTDISTKEAWNRFQGDMKSLAGGLPRPYKDGDADTKAAEVKIAMRPIGEATDEVFSSLQLGPRRPRGRPHTRRDAAT